jgi:hypothetical protein
VREKKQREDQRHVKRAGEPKEEKSLADETHSDRQREDPPLRFAVEVHARKHRAAEDQGARGEREQGEELGQNGGCCSRPRG